MSEETKCPECKALRDLILYFADMKWTIRKAPGNGFKATRGGLGDIMIKTAMRVVTFEMIDSSTLAVLQAIDDKDKKQLERMSGERW